MGAAALCVRVSASSSLQRQKKGKTAQMLFQQNSWKKVPWCSYEREALKRRGVVVRGATISKYAIIQSAAPRRRSRSPNSRVSVSAHLLCCQERRFSHPAEAVSKYVLTSQHPASLSPLRLPPPRAPLIPPFLSPPGGQNRRGELCPGLSSAKRRGLPLRRGRCSEDGESKEEERQLSRAATPPHPTPHPDTP